MNEQHMTPGDHHTREMYAPYGLAMYFVQVIEAAMKNALAMAQLESEQFATLDDFDDSWTKNFKVMMGTLSRRFEPFLGWDIELGEDLQLALALRNQLAHHFCWDHAPDAMTSDGLNRMITERMMAIQVFQEIEERFSLVVDRYSANAGTSPKVFAERLQGSMDVLLADSEDIGTRKCRRCLNPMEMVDSERRPYWNCKTCGAVAVS